MNWIKSSLCIAVLTTTISCDTGTYTPENQCEDYVGKGFLPFHSVPVQTELSPYESNTSTRYVGIVFDSPQEYNSELSKLESIEQEIQGVKRDSLDAVVDSLDFERDQSIGRLDEYLSRGVYGGVTVPSTKDVKDAFSLNPYDGEQGAVECDVDPNQPHGWYPHQ